MVVVSNKV